MKRFALLFTLLIPFAAIAQSATTSEQKTEYLAGSANAQAETKDVAAYKEMVDASHFIQNYKQMASESSAVYAARNQGSDREYAAFLAKVAKADLTDFKLCISRADAAGPLTVDDAKALTKVFRSPAGQRVLALSQEMLLADMRRGYHEPIDLSRLTTTDRQSIATLYKMPVFQRYGAFIASPAFKSALQTCIASSKVGRENGLKF